MTAREMQERCARVVEAHIALIRDGQMWGDDLGMEERRSATISNLNAVVGKIRALSCQRSLNVKPT